MYCRNCGTALEDHVAACPKCGVTITPPAPPPYNAQQPYQKQQQPYQNSYYNNYGQQPYQQPCRQQQDLPSAGFNALAFFFPLIGLILFLIWKDEKPVCARSIGKWGLIGFVAGVVLSIVLVVLAIAIFTFAAPAYDYGFYDNFAYGLAMRVSALLH